MKKTKTTSSISNTDEAKKNRNIHNKNVPSRTLCHFKPCICCWWKLERKWSTDRYLTSKTWRERLYLETYECINKKCDMFLKRIKSPEFNNLIFPWISYWIDLVAEMGLLRFRENKTIEDIHDIIINNYPHVEITERHVLNVINKIMYVFESKWLDPDIIKARLLAKNLDIKGLSISIDWLEPERGNEILYIVREIQAWEILFAKFLKFSDEDTILNEIYKLLKELSDKIKLPVIWLNADKQLTLTSAFKRIFPNVPIQHCQSHFLKAVRSPIQEESSKMSKEIKKTPNKSNRKRNR